MPQDAGINPVQPVIYGKHPCFGDFMALGLDHRMFQRLDDWLEAVLPKVKADFDTDWETVWRRAPALRFWLGPAVIGAPLFGVLHASWDKVGRRYPLIFGLTGSIAPPPVHPAHNEDIYAALHGHIAAFEGPSGAEFGAASLLSGFKVPKIVAADFDEETDAIMFGARTDGDLGRLFSDARSGDADKAQFGRSHWWHPSDTGRDALWLGTNGLPNAEALRWLLASETTSGSQQVSETGGASAEQPAHG